MAGKAQHPFRRRVRNSQDALPDVDISESDNIRSLHLGSATIQSSMDLDDPADLVLTYTRDAAGQITAVTAKNSAGSWTA